MKLSQKGTFLYQGLNCKGQSMVIFLSSLPVVLALAGTLFFMGEFLKERAQTLTYCRKGIHSLHSSQIQALKSLMQLNPRAKKLQKIERALKKASRAGASGNVVVVAGVIFSWATLRAAQAKLRLEQQAIFRTFENESRVRIARTVDKLKKHEPKTTKRKLSLPVFPTPLNSLSPTYSLLPGYHNLTKVVINWNQKLPHRNRSISKEHMTNPVKASCSGKINRKEGRWKIQIT